MSEAIEKRIVDLGLTGPRVTPARIAEVITGAYFHRPPHTTLTLCVLTLANGFTVTGESACADPANFNAKLGEDLAEANARQKVWALEAYLLCERMAGEPKSPKERAERERDELRSKLDKLYSFQSTVRYHELPVDARSLLASQASYMSGYLTALEQRLGIWSD